MFLNGNLSKMIIEIKGLSTGQKIKKILVDISFDYDGNETVEVQVNNQIKEQTKPQEVINNNPVQTKDNESREPKPIPQEMLDIEF